MYYKMKWVIGESSNNTEIVVCKQGFCNVYGVSSSHVDNIVKEIKSGQRATAPVFNDKSKVDFALFKDLQRVAKRFGLEISKK